MVRMPTDAELDRIKRETFERDAVEPRLQAVKYDKRTGRLTMTLQGDVQVSLPARSLKGLADATDKQLAAPVIRERGSSLHFDELDQQYDTGVMLAHALKLRTIHDVTAAAGRVKSERKAAAVRENGRKGGRPKGVKDSKPRARTAKVEV